MAVTPEQQAKATSFRALHEDGIFVMPCAWDAGSAKLLSSGFAAIGTTSGGVNWSRGRADYVYAAERIDMLADYGAIVTATELPVSGDLENGYGDEAADVVSTIVGAIEAGMVGGSIEDQADGGGLLPVNVAAARIEAARSAADARIDDFTITARPESFYGGLDDPLADAISRANAYVEAGADCIFVPGLESADDVAELVRSVDAPISLGIGSGGGTLSLAALEEMGVRRISTGGAIPRVMYASMLRALDEITGQGTFGFTSDAIGGDALERLLNGGR